jgi:NAD(P)-dependent dehydrogenase (short-subunit alcohol dehydrogenase family)
MAVHELSGTTAVVTGASRGFGLAIAKALAAHGVHVVAVARSLGPLDELKNDLGECVTTEVADVADPTVSSSLIANYRPRIIILNAGATPDPGSLQDQTWDNFSLNWNVDVRQVFNFVREALSAPLQPGSIVIAMSSGAALRGSPLSGGYAGAKSTVRFISSYAALESQRNSLDIRFVSVLPQITPVTNLGAAYVEAYAAYEGLSVDAYLTRMNPPLSVEQVGRSIVELAADDEHSQNAYLLTSRGLLPMTESP